ncbi:hypothetical protein N8824_04755 [Candidatus Pelagibacter sp.]|nr:hypothetical protein [Candidatus Pelagibacter sp.]
MKLKKNKKTNDTVKDKNICEECKKENISVFQNLILFSLKICDSCKTSKTIFPV